MLRLIDEDILRNLLIDQERLCRLEEGGVDNWEWYGEALNPEGEVDLDEFDLELDLSSYPPYEEKHRESD